MLTNISPMMAAKIKQYMKTSYMQNWSLYNVQNNTNVETTNKSNIKLIFGNRFSCKLLIKIIDF